MLSLPLTSSPDVAERPRDASCLSVASSGSSASDLPLFTNKFCSLLFVVVVHAAGCASLMRRRLCGKLHGVLYAYCHTCCSQVQQIWSSIANQLYRRRSRFVPTPPAFDATIRGVPVGILPWRLVWKNYNGLTTRWWKNFEDMFIRFDRVHKRDRQTDEHCVTA